MGGIFAGLAGAVLGLLGAMVVDDVFLGRKPIERPRGQVAIVPSLNLGQNGGSFGVAGRF
jgi:hypothetical protein